ncbi:type IV pilin protein [Legionella oakridgensis]|uniref:Prepilin-type N-terminal cleavage/methylation domain protein n=2 Tax=Legionella oakridgensis TaxID=29423 RepID=W0BDL6_9GAMM|nr:type IV pilin protein [Legionella oakridgensis]AHE66727.1 prepilin-type N-terminal cleavage/methylation domain protein [Legionella oakridgensis ATCC 33761 = DSM 21215]ETO93594.1 prepilin-type N-terminal cleavage/methylation domain protein [Legionella oakridgensis RV-2-2007]KTD38099.1 Type-IV pilin [Legionella oakridgensis]STY19859.1 Type-IV pilin [Legionella longbeachae]
MKKGFSLIELLIVLVVIGILASIAYPSYRDYISRARRSDGQSALLDLASRMERYYSENHTYQTATIGTGNATDVLSSAVSPEGWYTLAINNPTTSTYTLQATPRNAQATADTLCQTLTLNQLGVKGIATGPAGSPTGTASQCW